MELYEDPRLLALCSLKLSTQILQDLTKNISYREADTLVTTRCPFLPLAQSTEQLGWVSCLFYEALPPPLRFQSPAHRKTAFIFKSPPSSQILARKYQLQKHKKFGRVHPLLRACDSCPAALIQHVRRCWVVSLWSCFTCPLAMRETGKVVPPSQLYD